MASSFNEERAKQRRQSASDIDTYTKIALVHHYPFAYETVATKAYDTLLRKVTGGEDTFTRFEHAERFVSWCAERKVSMILHGHKHVPHHVRADVTIAGESRTLVVVGCGSTTGTENTPRCYDKVSLNPDTGRWGVTFYPDPSKAGAGFRAQEIAIDTRQSSGVW